MIRTMARVSDVHVLEEDHDELELPKVNEELRNFFLPRKAVAPEPEPVAAEEEPADKDVISLKKADDPNAANGKAVQQAAATEQLPQTPTSAYRAGAFDSLGLGAPVQAEALPSKPAKKWFSFTKSKSKLGKEAAPKGGSSSRFAVSHNPVADSDASRRFVQKHGLPERAAPAAELAAPAAHEMFTQPLPLPMEAPAPELADESAAEPAVAAPAAEQQPAEKASLEEDAAAGKEAAAAESAPAMIVEEENAAVDAAPAAEPVSEAPVAAAEASNEAVALAPVVHDEATPALLAALEPEAEAPVPNLAEPTAPEAELEAIAEAPPAAEEKAVVEEALPAAEAFAPAAAEAPAKEAEEEPTSAAVPLEASAGAPAEAPAVEHKTEIAAEEEPARADAEAAAVKEVGLAEGEAQAEPVQAPEALLTPPSSPAREVNDGATQGADQHLVLEAGQEVAAQEAAAAAGGGEAQPVEAADKEELSVPPRQAPALATVKEEHTPNSPTAGGKANCTCCVVA